jgi:hypothetical protein
MRVDNEVDMVANIDLGSEKESRKECDGIPETDFKGRPNLAGWCKKRRQFINGNSRDAPLQKQITRHSPKTPTI